ncbi:MAG: STAS domain-containing protein [Bacilli bacterium]|nr:STAS domain-containing protein [Bacilli bacterium]
MLEINHEFRKGVLFVRLNGCLSNSTLFKFNEVNNIIKDNGIRDVVFNLSDLYFIDQKGIKSILKCYELITKISGNMFICGINKNIRKGIDNSNLLSQITEIENELSILIG